jgi:hypothetical protein
MLIKNLYEYCNISSEIGDVIKNKATAYEYLIIKSFESYFDKTNDKLELYPIIENSIGTYLTPDLILCLNKTTNVVIIIEIKYFENSSSNKINARKQARQQMDKYVKAYKQKFDDKILMPLFITQNSYLDQYPKYPCLIILSKEINKINLDAVIMDKINQYLKNVR